MTSLDELAAALGHRFDDPELDAKELADTVGKARQLHQKAQNDAQGK